MKSLFRIILALSLLTPISKQAVAYDAPILLEIFTVSGSIGCSPLQQEDEYHNDDGTHKEGVPDDHDHTLNETTQENGIIQKSVEEIFDELKNENPNIIALNYLRMSQPHDHDEEGNNIITTPIEINEELNNFIHNYGYVYYKQESFLDKYNNFQMVIGGKFKTSGTMKHVADAAITRYKSEYDPMGIKMAINGQSIDIKLPSIDIQNNTQLLLISYDKEIKDETLKVFEGFGNIKLSNIVNGYKKLHTWNGAHLSETISVSEMDADGYVMIARDEETGQIYAIGKVEREA